MTERYSAEADVGTAVKTGQERRAILPLSLLKQLDDLRTWTLPRFRRPLRRSRRPCTLTAIRKRTVIEGQGLFSPFARRPDSFPGNRILCSLMYEGLPHRGRGVGECSFLSPNRAAVSYSKPWRITSRIDLSSQLNAPWNQSDLLRSSSSHFRRKVHDQRIGS